MACRCNSPVSARSAKVEKITDGGGTRRPLDKTGAHKELPADGKRHRHERPSAGRSRRAAPPGGGALRLTNASELNIARLDIVQGRVTWKRQTMASDRALWLGRRGVNCQLPAAMK